MSTDPLPILATLSAILGLGFLGYLLFERTRITDVLILITFGVLVGPVFGVFDVAGFKAATPVVGAIALLIIMFDGGLGLKLKDLLSGLARSTMLAVFGFALTVATVAAVAHYWLGMDWWTGALLGSIIGGTSSVVVMPIIKRTSASEDTRVMLSLESALTDILSVLGVVTVLGLMAGGATRLDSGAVSSSAQALAAQFSTAIVIGLFTGFLWLRLLKRLQSGKYSYMVTLAALLGIHVGTTALGGSGPLAVLVFGVVLGNGYVIARKFDFAGLEFSTEQRRFHEEVTFLVRVFFFVYLGVILDPAVLLNPAFMLHGLILLGALLAARLVAILVATWRDPETAPDRVLSLFLMPRGLAAAVLAGLPAVAALPGTENFLTYAFLIVVATNLTGTAVVVGYEAVRKRRATATVRPQPGAGAGPATEAPYAGAGVGRAERVR